jgi:hypothetical protein
MKSDWVSLALALGSALLMAGCGKPQSGTEPGAGEPAATATADTEQQAVTADSAAGAAATNGALTGGAEFATKSLASPFAQADAGLNESFKRALIAFQIEDYASAVSELDDLAATPDLTPAQQQAVKDLLAKALKMAPDLAASREAAATAMAQPPAEFTVAAPGDAEAPKNVSESPFSTADPAIKRSFARAKTAFDLGNYETAAVELKDLLSNPQLNFQQKYAVQAMLDKTPRK